MTLDISYYSFGLGLVMAGWLIGSVLRHIYIAMRTGIYGMGGKI